MFLLTPRWVAILALIVLAARRKGAASTQGKVQGWPWYISAPGEGPNTTPDWCVAVPNSLHDDGTSCVWDAWCFGTEQEAREAVQHWASEWVPNLGSAPPNLDCADISKVTP